MNPRGRPEGRRVLYSNKDDALAETMPATELEVLAENTPATESEQALTEEMIANEPEALAEDIPAIEEEALKTAYRVAEGGEAINIGCGDAIQHFTDVKGASGITGVSEEVLAGLEPGQQIVVDAAHFKPGTNPFLTGEGGGVGVTKLGKDATQGQLEGIGLFGDKQNFVIEFSRETVVTSNAELTAVMPDRSIFSLPGNASLTGTITITKIR